MEENTNDKELWVDRIEVMVVVVDTVVAADVVVVVAAVAVAVAVVAEDEDRVWKGALDHLYHDE
jgi:hypothetical protein